MASFKTKSINSSSGNARIISRRNVYQNKIKPKNGIKKIIKILIFIASVSILGILGINALSGIQLGGNEESKIFQPIIDIVNNTEGESHKEEKKLGTKNILIGGIGGKGHPGGELTDSLMLASLNFDNKTATLLSIPRDLYVGYNSMSGGKINTLYPIGQSQGQGVNLLAKKVSEITGQPIHHYVIVDFAGFKKIVDTLGGVTVDVPNRIYDREYPNNNWGYELFVLEKGIQELDGSTALKFVRSRHSTSDFDRSSRQQLLLRAIKDKALSLGIITNPLKIGEIFNSVKASLSTDLTIGDLVNIGVNFKDMNNKDIVMYSLNDACLASDCFPGSYLYQPMRDLFGGAWVLLPEGATASRVSKYDYIRRYVGLIFEHPHLKDSEKTIHIVTNKKNAGKAKDLRKNLEQLGFPLDHGKAIYYTGATLGNSKIISRWNPEGEIGFNENHILIQSLKKIEGDIPLTLSEKNEFISGGAPVIEIILGDDMKNYFNFSQPIKFQSENFNLKDNTQALTE